MCMVVWFGMPPISHICSIVSWNSHIIQVVTVDIQRQQHNNHFGIPVRTCRQAPNFAVLLALGSKSTSRTKINAVSVPTTGYQKCTAIWICNRKHLACMYASSQVSKCQQAQVAIWHATIANLWSGWPCFHWVHFCNNLQLHTKRRNSTVLSGRINRLVHSNNQNFTRQKAELN